MPVGRILFDADGKASVAQMQAKSIAKIGVNTHLQAAARLCVRLPPPVIFTK